MQTLASRWRWALIPVVVVLGSVLAIAAIVTIVAILAYPQLPAIDSLTDYRPKIPLRIFTSDGFLIGEFGEERRNFVRISDLPPTMKQAILAAEDERFYQHPGFDIQGLARAAYSTLILHHKQGASTITQQVARNFFLTSEQNYVRKIYEILLAVKIEHALTKDEILQVYVNQIYLGQRAYGFASAAQIYFGKPLSELSVAETAMLAGLPKAPSAYNPVANPKRAALRQRYVLRRMHDLEFIDDAQFKQAQAEPLHVKRGTTDFGIPADFVAEMARQMVVERFPDNVYGNGLKVITTITKADQIAASASLRRAVLEYDRRHAYRGAEGYVNMKDISNDTDDGLEELLQDFEDSGDLLPAVVLEATPTLIRAYLRGGEILKISEPGLKFAKRMLDDKAAPNKRLRRGAVIRVQKATDKNGDFWQILQLPEAEAAFVAASPVDGAIRALVGGFDFNRNKFNHVTQAWRQPGSSFKPFIYSASLEKGFHPGSIFDDAPIVISAEETGSQDWAPKNYDGKYEGPMTMRTALTKSKNMVSIRILKSISPHYAQDYATKFGFDADKNPPYLTLALGAGAVTPWQQLTAYSVFANGGYRITPFLVRQIVDDQGNVLAETKPELAGDESLRIIDARNAWLMDSMMHDVTRRGTAAGGTARLKRADLAGKTGTTNDYIDAWFCGYQPNLVGIAWIGFDQPRRLGDGETGGSAALPIWVGYMEKALAGIPESFQNFPEGLVQINVADPSGKQMRDYIYAEQVPGGGASEPEEVHHAPAPVRDAKIKPVEAGN
ncbi:MAG: penicillin-binding protein 1A [Rhodocyclaceae bacterium]|nr:penicillin-binding protein 1A [Rhodocyclaceae bacterium]MBP6108728.1 penicillin-binding protein 1A [Rhodocyclaceae bacterium]MBP6278857.1 penicillin-binding protein 1A [Rhodocyclaceae bacterium]